jgi:transketolase
MNFDCTKCDKIELGKGIEISEGVDIIIIGYGSLMLSEAIKVSQKFYDQEKVKIKVINLPWLNFIDEKWLIQTLENSKIVITLDNHYTIGGQGDRISKILSNVNVKSYQLFNLGVDEVPVSGQNNEVLSYHKLDFLSIFNFIKEKF